MPGLADLQQQYVRFKGTLEAKESADGWTLSKSVAAANASDPTGDAASRLTSSGSGLPEQVQLEITSAPAEYCLPVKNDRQFKPCFQVQVTVTHSNHMHLPLRVKAFAVHEEEFDRVLEWLPQELRSSSSQTERRPRAQIELKGGTVVSNVFKTTMTSMGRPTIAQIPQMPSDNGRVTTSTISPSAFPSRSPATGGSGSRTLKHNDSIHSQSDDPEMATCVNRTAPNDRSSSSVVANYEFRSLEFAKPTRMNRVYMVFACLVAEQDLLFVAYNIPCISICRAEQRAKALEKLQLPRSVYDDVIRHGGSAPTVIGMIGGPSSVAQPEESGGGSAGATTAPSTVSQPEPPSMSANAYRSGDRDDSSNNNNAPGGKPNTMQAVWMTATQQRHQASNSEGSDHRNGGLQMPISSENDGGPSQARPPLFSNERSALFDFLGSQVQGLTPMDRSMDPSDLQRLLGTPLPSGMDDLNDFDFPMGRSAQDAQATAELVAGLDTSIAGIRDIMEDPTANMSIGDVGQFDDLHYNKMSQLLEAIKDCPSEEDRQRLKRLASRPAERNDPSRRQQLGAGPPTGPDFGPDGGISEVLRTVPPFLGNSGAHGAELGTGIRAPSEPASRSLEAFDMNSLLEPTLAAGSLSANGGGVGGQVTQQDAYNWIIQEYQQQGFKRELLRYDLIALLSQAGFPELAGRDVNATVGAQQFEEFKDQFRRTLRLLARVVSLWDISDPCFISGFEMDRKKTQKVLQNQPFGTFICRFSMHKAGSLVLSCKVPPESLPAEVRGDGLQHYTIDLNEVRQVEDVKRVIFNCEMASHVLDVYTNRRVDKRTILWSNYMSLRTVVPPVGANNGGAAMNGMHDNAPAMGRSMS